MGANLKKGVIFINILQEYHEIMVCEKFLAKRPYDWVIVDAREIQNTVHQIHQIAISSTVIRSYAQIYGLTGDNVAFESVGAHTNLMLAVVDRTLAYFYGPRRPEPQYECYSYREIMEAIRRHDLPENITGDEPDNGTQDRAKKSTAEQDYQYNFSKYSPSREINSEARIKQLLLEMEQKSSSTGRILYVADKICAILITLCLDALGMSPVRQRSDPTLSKQDRSEMQLCDQKIGDACLASEMWTADYLKIRHLVDYDDSGYLTALLVMYTLETKGSWYSWRKRDYVKLHQ